MNIKAALVGACAASMALSAFFTGWGSLGIETGVWIDGCPDVVAAYAETHGACPVWWKDVYIGQATQQVIQAGATSRRGLILVLGNRWTLTRSFQKSERLVSAALLFFSNGMVSDQLAIALWC